MGNLITTLFHIPVHFNKLIAVIYKIPTFHDVIYIQIKQKWINMVYRIYCLRVFSSIIKWKIHIYSECNPLILKHTFWYHMYMLNIQWMPLSLHISEAKQKI